jgi:hypothetical protein
MSLTTFVLRVLFYFPYLVLVTSRDEIRGKRGLIG